MCNLMLDDFDFDFLLLEKIWNFSSTDDPKQWASHPFPRIKRITGKSERRQEAIKIVSVVITLIEFQSTKL